MNESEFNALAVSTLDRLAAAIEGSQLECDCEFKGDGVLEIEFENGIRIIVNRQSAAQELWVAAKSGGFHFRHDGTSWLNARDGSELFATLSRLVSEQSGQSVVLGPVR